MRHAVLSASSAFALLAMALLFGCAAPAEREVDTARVGSVATAHVPKVVAVSIEQMKFQPETLRVHQGDTVVFTNKDLVDHDVTALPDHVWTSKPLQTGDSWRWVADKSTDYFCSLHVVMRGRLEVEK